MSIQAFLLFSFSSYDVFVGMISNGVDDRSFCLSCASDIASAGLLRHIDNNVGCFFVPLHFLLFVLLLLDDGFLADQHDASVVCLVDFILVLIVIKDVHK